MHSPGHTDSPSFNGFTPERARRLFKAGADDLALAYLNKFIGKGNTRAMLAMADHEYDRGNIAASLSWVASVESRAISGDYDACIYLASAYRRGLGAGSPEERAQKSLRMLEQAAEHGYVSCAHELMTNYLYGFNGAQVSKERFTYWARKAASYGSTAAAEALNKLDQWPHVVLKE